MSKAPDNNIYFEGSPAEKTPLPYQDNSFNPDRFKGGASNFLKGFMSGRGMPISSEDDEDEGFKLPETSPSTDFFAGSRGNKYATQSRNNALNIASQDFGRGVQQGKFYDDFSLDTFTPTADFSIEDELKTRNIDYTKANTNLSADQGITSTVVNHDDHTTSIADEIDQRQTDAYTNATAKDADAINTGEGTEFAIFSQTDDPNLNETINTNLPTDADIEKLENFQINTLNTATKDDPALKEDFGNADTSGLAIYQDDEDTGINVSDRLTENNIDIEASQYTGTGNEIDINATGAVDAELRQRQEDAYGEAVENDPWDGVYNPEGLSGDYDPQANLDNYNLITPTVDSQPINNTSPTPDPTPDPTPPENTPDPGDGNQTPDPIQTPEDALTSERDARIEERWQMHLNTINPDEMDYLTESAGGLDEMKEQWMNTMDARFNPQRTSLDFNFNVTPGARDKVDPFGENANWEKNSGYYNEDGTLKTPYWQQQQQTRAGQNASSDESRDNAGNVDQTSLQPIGTEGVVNDDTTNTQQQGSSAAEEISIEAETRDNQQALQSNEIVASGGSDTALMQQSESAQPEWQSLGFEDEDEMQRFEDKYTNYVKTARDIGHLNITDTTKDEMREAFFKVDRPAYKQDQKVKAHNAVIDEAKQRGVDSGVFKNIGDVNNWITRLNKKQAGKFVGYSDQNKEGFLTENKLDTMRYM